jgi:hypothetical protein
MQKNIYQLTSAQIPNRMGYEYLHGVNLKNCIVISIHLSVRHLPEETISNMEN